MKIYALVYGDDFQSGYFVDCIFKSAEGLRAYCQARGWLEVCDSTSWYFYTTDDDDDETVMGVVKVCNLKD